jgi:hypothetical protein
MQILGQNFTIRGIHLCLGSKPVDEVLRGCWCGQGQNAGGSAGVRIEAIIVTLGLELGMVLLDAPRATVPSRVNPTRIRVKVWSQSSLFARALVLRGLSTM